MYTSTAGFWGYNEFCEKMRTEKPQWTVVRVGFLTEIHVLSTYVELL